jgi:hypothetical protein
VPEDLTGRRPGSYRIDGVIGRGGMSVRHPATERWLGRTVALTVIGDRLAPAFRRYALTGGRADDWPARPRDFQ